MNSPFAMKRGRSAMVSVALNSISSGIGQDIPSVASLKDKAHKVGFLKKLSGKGILTSGTWRQRYCLLVKTRLYYFENEDSSGKEKSAGFVNLEYFDCCTEASARISRKAENVFVIAATDKGFFDSHSGRIYFAAESMTELTEWITAISLAMNKMRPKDKRSSQLREKSPNLSLFKTQGKESRLTKARVPEGDGLESLSALPASRESLDCRVIKTRVRGPQGRRLPRKSLASFSSPAVRKTVKATIEKSEEDNVDELKECKEEEERDDEDELNNKAEITLSTLNEADANEEGSEKSRNGSTSSNSTTNNSDKGGEHASRGTRASGLKETWRSSRSMDWDPMMDPSFTRNPAMTYCYSSSSEDSLALHENKKDSLTRVSVKKTDLEPIAPSKVPLIPPRTPTYRAGSASKNSTVTPPPCVLRKIRHDYSASSTPRSSRDLDGDDSLAFLGEIGGGTRRTSSGSSLSTLTAEPRHAFSRHISFSSLQRPPKQQQEESSIMSSSNESNIYQTIRNGSLTRGSSSTNASPLLHSHRHHTSSSPHTGRSYGGHGHSNSLGNSNSGNQKGKGGFSLERNLESIKMDLGAMIFETRQLDADVSSLRQDVGSVQENIATVRGTLALTSERVVRLGNQVCAIERQVGNVVKEANSMRDRAMKLMEEAETSRATHMHLQEEAENLVSFLRQMTHGCYNQSGQHMGTSLRNHCCSSSTNGNYQSHGAFINSNNAKNNVSNTNGTSSGGHVKFCPTPAPRKSRTPERMLDDEDMGAEAAGNMSQLESSGGDLNANVRFSDELRDKGKGLSELDDEDTKSEISLLAEF